METRRYIRKPFYVDVVEVTDENFDEVAEWTKGVKAVVTAAGRCIRVPVANPMNERQTLAHVGDFVLQATNGFKVFTRIAFERSFMPAPEEKPKPGPRSPRAGGKKGTPSNVSNMRRDAAIQAMHRGHVSDEDVAAGL